MDVSSGFTSLTKLIGEYQGASHTNQYDNHKLNLVEDNDEELIGCPIEVQIEMPPQELLEVLRNTLIRDEEYVEVNQEADLLVRMNRALPEYEDPPAYV